MSLNIINNRIQSDYFAVLIRPVQYWGVSGNYCNWSVLYGTDNLVLGWDNIFKRRDTELKIENKFSLSNISNIIIKCYFNYFDGCHFQIIHTTLTHILHILHLRTYCKYDVIKMNSEMQPCVYIWIIHLIWYDKVQSCIN